MYCTGRLQPVFPYMDLKHFNFYHFLGLFNRRQIDDSFLIFPRKRALTFHANCLKKEEKMPGSATMTSRSPS